MGRTILRTLSSGAREGRAYAGGVRVAGELGSMDAALAAGRAALAAAAWTDAREAFRRALESGDGDGSDRHAEALEGVGEASWWLDDADAVFDARERAYAMYRQQGNALAAARVATALAEDCVSFRGEPAVAQGWIQRAHDLLANEDPSVEHGWLAVCEGDLVLSGGGDPAVARQRAEEAEAVGRALGCADLETVGRALRGSALVAQGHVVDGMRELDAAVATALGDDLSNLFAVTFACCALVTACARTRDIHRATQWGRRVQAYAERIRFRAFHAICRTQHAIVMIGRGDWEAAERDLEQVASQSSTRIGLEDQARIRLAGLRRRQGRTREAQEMLEQLESHPLAILERAALALDRRDTTTAVHLAERFVRTLPAGNRIDRLSALEITLRAHVAAGHPDRAAAALAAMADVSVGEVPEPIRAALKVAEGLVARSQGELDAARCAFEDALDLLRRNGAEFDAACAQLELARCLEASGNREAATREARDASAALSRIGAMHDGAHAHAMLRRLEDHDRLSPREREVLELVAAGLTNKQIASQLFISQATVKRHVQNILGKLELPTRAAAAAHAVRRQIA